MKQKTKWIKQEKVPHAVPTLICHGPSIYLKFLVKKGHHSKTIAFRVMPLLQLHLVMMSNYSRFGVDTFNTFCVMGYIKVFAWHQWWQQRWSSNHNSSTFLWNRGAKNVKCDRIKNQTFDKMHPKSISREHSLYAVMVCIDI